MFRRFLLLVFIAVSISLQAQEFTLKKVPTRFRFTYETISQDNEPDLGFVGLGYDLLALNLGKSKGYLGLHSYSAVAGERPGLITLGMSAGAMIPLWEKAGLFLDTGFFVGGGGGGAAADGGGLIIRPHIELEKQFGNIGLRAGFSRIDFPTGELNGNQFNFGITINENVFFNTDRIYEKALEKPSLLFKNLRVAFVTTVYQNLEEGSLERSRGSVDGRRIGLVGAQVERGINKYLNGLFKINGALKGGTDGYMSILFGAGGQLPLLDNHLKLQANALIGPSGGGGILSGGGATAQFEGAIAVQIFKGYDIKLAAGKTFAPWGDFNANHIELSVGKTLTYFSPRDLQNEAFKVDSADLWKNHMSFAVFNRTYFSPDALDRGGRPYLDNFQNLGFEFQKYVGERFALNATTIWAYEGDYGAYAEGLVGLAYYQPIFGDFYIPVKGLVGAAGGGGLNVGSGLITQFNTGLQWNSNAGDLFLQVGKYIPLEGNFDPMILDIGFRFHIEQLFKK